MNLKFKYREDDEGKQIKLTSFVAIEKMQRGERLSKWARILLIAKYQNI